MDITNKAIISVLKESLSQLATEGKLQDTVKEFKQYEEEYRTAPVCGGRFYSSVKNASVLLNSLGVKQNNIHPNQALGYVVQACNDAMLTISPEAKLDPKTHCPKCGHFMGVV